MLTRACEWVSLQYNAKNLRVMSCHILSLLVCENFCCIMCLLMSRGPALELVGQKYYVSFVNDYSKFTWVHLIKFMLEVFHKFKEFWTIGEWHFNCKVLAMKLIKPRRGITKAYLFFSSIISYYVSCSHAQKKQYHRHIDAVGLALLSHISMSIKY
jgi:hypothetical protein